MRSLIIADEKWCWPSFGFIFVTAIKIRPTTPGFAKPHPSRRNILLQITPYQAVDAMKGARTFGDRMRAIGVIIMSNGLPNSMSRSISNSVS